MQHRIAEEFQLLAALLHYRPQDRIRLQDFPLVVRHRRPIQVGVRPGVIAEFGAGDDHHFVPFFNVSCCHN